jgi:hypothetical protein
LNWLDQIKNLVQPGIKKPDKKPVDFLKKILDQNNIVLICKNVLGQPSDL